MTSPKPTAEKIKKPRKSLPSVCAHQKVQAVLAVWTERCKPVDVCRQLNINWITFQQWQKRAIEGMLQALESRTNLARGDVLSARLQALLRPQTVAPGKLQQRLEQLQDKPPSN